MARLTTEERNELPDSDFVYPKERRYPIQDIDQARIALRMVKAYGTDSEIKKVTTEVFKRYPSLKDEEMERRREAQGE